MSAIQHHSRQTLATRRVDYSKLQVLSIVVEIQTVSQVAATVVDCDCVARNSHHSSARADTDLKYLRQCNLSGSNLR